MWNDYPTPRPDFGPVPPPPFEPILEHARLVAGFLGDEELGLIEEANRCGEAE
jgi:hypothetical protein